jgi:hypothetical protein
MRQLGKFLKMLKKRSAERKAREEAARRARILRLKASKRSGGVLPTEGSTTDSESESEDVPARARRMSKSEEAASAGNKGGDASEEHQQQQQQQQQKTKAKSKKAALVSTLNVPALVTNVAHEVSYVFLSNALYFSSCYFWTGTLHLPPPKALELITVVVVGVVRIGDCLVHRVAAAVDRCAGVHGRHHHNRHRAVGVPVHRLLCIHPLLPALRLGPGLVRDQHPRAHQATVRGLTLIAQQPPTTPNPLLLVWLAGTTTSH